MQGYYVNYEDLEKMKLVRVLGFLGLLFVLGLVGCATTGEESMEEAQAGEAVGGPGTSGKVSPLYADEALTLDALNDPASPLAKRIVYFEYDSAEIQPQFVDVLVAHGRFLAKYPQQRIRLEGHTDERGSREYNLALAESRAQSVMQLLKLEGANGNQLELISYGEELPAAQGHDESAWQLNRRVELVYQE